MERAITRITAFLATPAGSQAINLFQLLGLAAVWWSGWIDGALLAFTLALSIMANSLTSLVLVGQDRDTKAIQAKLDEILRSIPEASNALVGIEK